MNMRQLRSRRKDGDVKRRQIVLVTTEQAINIDTCLKKMYTCWNIGIL